MHEPPAADTRRPPDADRYARLRAALEKGPWILGESFSAADLLLHGPYVWFPDATPDDPLIRDWIERCKARPASVKVREADAARMAQLVA